MITIVNPRVGRPDRFLRLAPRPHDLSGKTVGFLDNGKRNFDAYLERTEELLRERFAFTAIHRRKPQVFKAVPQELFEELVERCDVVITGSGD